MQRADQLSDEHTMDKPFLSIKELGRRWSVCRQTVNNCVIAGHITPIHLGTRVLIPISEVHRYEQKLLDDAQASKIR